MIDNKYSFLLLQVMLLVAFALSMIMASTIIGTVRDNIDSSTGAYSYAANASTSITIFASFIRPMAFFVIFVWIVTMFYTLGKWK